MARLRSVDPTNVKTYATRMGPTMRGITIAPLLTALLIACGDSAEDGTPDDGAADASSAPNGDGSPGDGSGSGPSSDGAPDADASPGPIVGSNEDAGTTPDSNPGDGSGSMPSAEAGSTNGDDGSSGAPQRNAMCTPLSAQTGTAVNTNHGRLDGTLVYVLPIDGSSACNGDGAHVHLQIEVSGSVYDVAVDIGKSGDEVGWYQQVLPVPGGTWSEGWHGSDDLGYSSLGLSSSEFATLAPMDMGNEVEALLANTSKISVFCTGYTPGDNGCHDVHYQDGTSQDGAIVLDPTSTMSPTLFLRFTNQSF
jgi:hypothetical protein